MEETRESNLTNENNRYARFRPVLSKRWLLIIAGCMWSAVGIMLMTYAIVWLTRELSISSILLGLLGVALSAAMFRFIFKKVASKNVNRILSLDDKACLFSFQPWTSYLIIVFMMTLGIILKNSAIPKPYLAVVYMTIGSALFQASITYYTHFAVYQSSGVS